MAHIHSVKDTDVHYKIDGITRTIVNVNETKRMLVQNDHNSERLTFEVPRYVDGHDLTTCNVVQIHYLNYDTYEENASSGVYEVDDLGIKGVTGDDASVVILTWLVSGNATKYIGTLNFIIRFSCVTDGVIEYAWNTTIFKGIQILEGIYNSNQVIEENYDILNQWKQELIAAGVDALTLDKTLLVEGEAADARAVGDAIYELAAKINMLNTKGGGLSANARALLVAILRSAVYTSNQNTNITALETALAESSSGSGDATIYTITNNLTNVVTNNSLASAVIGTAYRATLTAEDGYVLDDVIVTMAGADITDSVYKGGLINISSVTGDIVITATAVEKEAVVTYSITSNLTNVISGNMATSIQEGCAFYTILEAIGGYSLDSVIVTMGGVDITSSAYSNGVIDIFKVTGDVIITAYASEVVYVNNLFDKDTMVQVGKYLNDASPFQFFNYADRDTALVPVTKTNCYYAVHSDIYPWQGYKAQLIYLVNDVDGVPTWTRRITPNGYGLAHNVLYTENTDLLNPITDEAVCRIDDTGVGYTFFVPDGTQYIAFGCKSSDIGDTASSCMLEYGTACHDYVEYA